MALPPTSFEPFVASLRATDYRGRLGLVLGHYGAADVRTLTDLADFAVDVSGDYARVSPILAKILRATRQMRRVRRAYPFAFSAVAIATPESRALSWRRALEYELEGLQALRYDHYFDILQRHALDVDQILLTDVRDVLFQRDPFETPVETLEVFLEDPSRTIGSESHNRAWIRALYGPTELALLRDNVASCSGTVVGRRPDILHYLDQMTRAMASRRRPLGSHDQGVHNYLLRHGQLAPVTVIQNGRGRVLTMGGMDRAAIHRDAAGGILNCDGSVPAILHQYDRHPTVARALVESVRRRAS